MAADKKRRKADKPSEAKPEGKPADDNPSEEGSNNRMKIVLLVAALGFAAALPFTCEDKPDAPKPSAQREPAAATTPGPRPSAAASPDHPPSPESGGDGEIHWKKPAAWKEAGSPSPMRKATYQIARADGDPEDAELSVIVAGGDTGANIERWEGQFGGNKAKTTQRSPNGLAITIAEIDGEYAGGGPMMGGGADKKPGWMMLAAIADTSGGQHYFFKLTGPKKTVEAARKDFDALVDSISK